MYIGTWIIELNNQIYPYQRNERNIQHWDRITFYDNTYYDNES